MNNFPWLITLLSYLINTEFVWTHFEWLLIFDPNLNSDKPHCRACDVVLGELENIDDDCEVYGINFVKISDNSLAKRYGIKAYPALIYFRNGNPLIYDGNLLLFINVCLNYKCLNTLNFILSGFFHFISFHFNWLKLYLLKLLYWLL